MPFQSPSAADRITIRHSGFSADRYKLVEKIVYGVFAIASGVAAIVAAFLGITGAASLSTLLCFLFLLAANPDRFSKFKASLTGIEAETRALVERAEVTLEQVRALAVITAQLALSLTARIGRVGTYSDAEKEAVRRDLAELCRGLGATQAQLAQIENDYHRFNQIDYALCIALSFNANELQRRPDLHQRWRDFRGRLPEHVPSPDELRGLMVDAGLLDTVTQELLLDFDHYCRTNRHRRPEVWARRDGWTHEQQEARRRAAIAASTGSSGS
jgi:hypothetical protein